MFTQKLAKCERIVNENKYMRKRNPTKEFGLLIDNAIDDAGLDKETVAAETGIHFTTLYRIISGELGIDKARAPALVRAINKLAREEIIDEREAMKKAGFEIDSGNCRTIQIGDGVCVVISPADKFSTNQLNEIARDLQLTFEVARRRISAPAKNAFGTGKGT